MGDYGNSDHKQRNLEPVQTINARVSRGLGYPLMRHAVVRYGWAVVIIILTTAVVIALQPLIRGHATTIQLLYLLGVLLAATTAGLGPALLAALLSFLGTSYFFVEPRFDFRPTDPDDTIRLVAFLAIAFIAGILAAHARTQAERAERRMAESQALYTISQAVDQERSLNGSLAQMVQTTAYLLQSPFCAILVTDPNGQVQAQAAWGNREESMCLEEMPLIVRSHTLGCLQVALPASASRFSHDDRHLLQILSTQIAQSLERVQLAEEAARARVLAESDRLKSAILSSVSHDLRTPLAAIRGAVDELTATDVDWPPETRQQLLDTIGDQSRRLNYMVSNLLDLSRIRSGALQPHKDWYAIDEVIHHTVDDHQALLTQHPLTLELPPTPPLVALDFVLTEQVLSNLLINAVTHTPAGTPIAIHVAVTADQVTVCVADRGPGIPEAVRTRIFEPFYRLNHRAGTSGSGVGLAICRGFVEAQGGAIWVEEHPGGGACFCFTLPYTVTPEEHYETTSDFGSGH